MSGWATMMRRSRLYVVRVVRITDWYTVPVVV